MCRYQVTPFTKINHSMTEHFRRLGEHCEEVIDSVLNHLATGNLQQYTTIISQCEQLLWNWMWCLLYFDCWSHFKKRTGSHKSVACNQLALQQEACLWSISVIQSLFLWWFINIVIIYIIVRYMGCRYISCCLPLTYYDSVICIMFFFLHCQGNFRF